MDTTIGAGGIEPTSVDTSVPTAGLLLRLSHAGGGGTAGCVSARSDRATQRRPLSGNDLTLCPRSQGIQGLWL
eukprot:gene12415-biopygen7576